MLYETTQPATVAAGPIRAHMFATLIYLGACTLWLSRVPVVSEWLADRSIVRRGLCNARYAPPPNLWVTVAE